MPTLVGILTLTSMIKENLRELKQERSLFVGILRFISSWNSCSVELSMTKYITGAWVYSPSMWVPPGNVTITHCRPTHGNSREIHRTLTAGWKQTFINRGYLPFWGEYQIYIIKCFKNIRIFTSAQHECKSQCFQLTRWHIVGICWKQINFIFIFFSLKLHG